MPRKRKFLPPPPNQTSIRAFISGATNWKVGESPLDQEELEKFKSYYEDRERAPEDQLFEADIHEKLLAGGSFHHFANRQSALAYMHGQFLMRKMGNGGGGNNHQDLMGGTGLFSIHLRGGGG